MDNEDEKQPVPTKHFRPDELDAVVALVNQYSNLINLSMIRNTQALVAHENGVKPLNEAEVHELQTWIAAFQNLKVKMEVLNTNAVYH